MKTNFILIVLVTLVATDGCRKNKVENKPIEEKSLIEPAIEGRSIETIAYIPLLSISKLRI
jgi:hypothetical protein